MALVSMVNNKSPSNGDLTEIFCSFYSKEVKSIVLNFCRAAIEKNKHFPEASDYQPFSFQCCLLSRNQLINLHCKSVDWFLYNRKHCQVKNYFDWEKDKDGRHIKTGVVFPF